MHWKDLKLGQRIMFLENTGSFKRGDVRKVVRQYSDGRKEDYKDYCICLDSLNRIPSYTIRYLEGRKWKLVDDKKRNLPDWF